MNDYIRIATLNDFLFCPKSIYFHQLYEEVHDELYKEKVQYAGRYAHQTIDEQTYSTSRQVLQAVEVYSRVYRLFGIIDIFGIDTGVLVERKKHVQRIYQGYIYQLRGQYLCLQEMGYTVTKLYVYSKDDNKKYAIRLPTHEDVVLFNSFLETYRAFDPGNPDFTQNPRKCQRCIYRELCDTYLSAQESCTHQETFRKNR